MIKVKAKKNDCVYFIYGSHTEFTVTYNTMHTKRFRYKGVYKKQYTYQNKNTSVGEDIFK